jgi:hypothetical protein
MNGGLHMGSLNGHSKRFQFFILKNKMNGGPLWETPQKTIKRCHLKLFYKNMTIYPYFIY